MPLVDAGRNHMVQAAIGGAVTAFNNANAYIGVGNSSTAQTTSQTDLQAAAGSANQQRKAMDSGYPSGATNVIQFRSTFATTEANFAWQEWGVFNAASGGTMLSRKVESLGTKTNTQTWQFTVTLTFTTA